MTAVAGADRVGEEPDGRDPGYAALKAFEGRASGPPWSAPDEVNQAMIRHWVEAMGDDNPVYVDEAAARAEGLPGVIAPATMLQAWIMRGLKASAAVEAARAEGRQPADPSPMDELFAVLDGAGCTSIVATNCEQRYTRPLVLGDRLSVQSFIDTVSPRKTTVLGAGHFITSRMVFTDQAGAEVATMLFRVYKYRPARAPDAGGSGDGGAAAVDVDGGGHGRPAGAPRAPDAVADRPAAAAPTEGTPTPPAGGGPASPRRPRPAVTADNAFFFEGTRRGELLVQRCGGCGRLRHPPLPACPQCRSLDWAPVPVAGTGTIYSFVVVHHPQVPAFDYPLPIALVELDDGVRMVGQLVGVDPAAVRIGMAVAAELTAVDDELTLPLFRPTEVAR